MSKEEIKELAGKHWGFIQELLAHLKGKSKEEIDLMGYIYIQAFIHGFKHGKRRNEQRQP